MICTIHRSPSLRSLLILPLLVAYGCSGEVGNNTPPPTPANSAPVASNVAIVDNNGGAALLGDTLTGSYDFTDDDGDIEGTSTYRWLRDGVAITGAEQATYALAAEDIPASITFEVTPVADAGTLTGAAVSSAPLVTTVPLNTDASLADLSLDNLDLDPAFDPAQTDYTATTIYRTSQTEVSASANDGNASFTINGGNESTIPLSVGDNDIDIAVTAEDGTTTRTYSIVVMRSEFAQQAYIKASNPGISEHFGARGVRLSGDGNTLVVGAEQEGSGAIGVNGDQDDNSSPRSGAAYIFTRDAAAAWTQQAYIKASNTFVTAFFGNATAISEDGNTVAIASRFEFSRATGVNGDDTDRNATAAGAAYVFVRDTGGTWVQQAYIKASNTDAGDSFGVHVSLSADGNTLAVSTDLEDSAATGINGNQADNSERNSGAAYVYTRDAGGVWSQQAYIKASNTESNDRFGRAISLSDDGNLMAVGAFAEDSDATGVDGDQSDNSRIASGAVYLYARDTAGSWTQTAYIKASNTGDDHAFGYDLELSGDGSTLAVGANQENSEATGIDGDQADDSSESSGAVYLFARDATDTWAQQAYVKASNTDADDMFGTEVALSHSGDVLAVSAIGESSSATGIDGDQSNNSRRRSGAVYLFMRDADNEWSQEIYVKASDSDREDEFGTGIDVSGDGSILAVGAPFEDSESSGINGDSDKNKLIDSGAVYVYQ